MKPHLLRFEGPSRVLEPLIRAAGESGLRIGWLELGEAGSGPPNLELLTSWGVLRAVAAGGGRSVAVKPLRGRPVLRDLLREHFRGCALVLVRGAVEAPLLESQDDGWRIVLPDGKAILWRSQELLAALRRPRPWPA